MKRVATLQITETQFSEQVIELAQLRSWRVAHFRSARTGRTYTGKDGQKKEKWTTPVQADGAGFPDLVLVRMPRVIFAELKSDKGKVSEAQAKWLFDLGRCPGVEVYAWYPQNWEEIVETLGGGL